MNRRASPLAAAGKACGPAFAATAFMSVFINLTMLALPLYSIQVYDRVLTSRNEGTLLMLTLIVIAFLALYGFLEYVRTGIQLRASILFDETLRRQLFDTLMRAEVSGISKLGPQTLRDADMLRDSISSGLVSTMFDVPWAPVFVGLCFILHPLLGVVALSGAIILFAFALAFGAKLVAVLLGSLAFRFVEPCARRADWRSFLVAFAFAVVVVLPFGTLDATRALRKKSLGQGGAA